MFEFRHRRSGTVSRRRLLGMLGAGPGLRSLARLPWFSALPRLSVSGNSRPAFEEIPSAASGITWVHSNARSEEMYLPETTGAGCAFLDYDNDGWMDIYLVNSGECDFFKPPTPLQNALYRNNRDGTFTNVTVK